MKTDEILSAVNNSIFSMGKYSMNEFLEKDVRRAEREGKIKYNDFYQKWEKQ